MDSNSPDIENGSERIDRSRSITEQIIREITESDRRSREDLEPLYEAIDPDALTALFAPRADGSSRGGGKVSFEYAGCWVIVSSGGAVNIGSEIR
jgi:Halobacterial output domain 1